MASPDDRPPAPAEPLGGPPVPEPRELRRPNLSGDLLRTLTHAPVFRRAIVGGYDRFQVDAYVQWAEDELASAGRQRADLVAHLARTQTDLDEARRLTRHSPAGGEFLRLSRRIGVLLAAAADQADGMRADGEAEHAAAKARAHRLVDEAVARAEQLVAEAAAEAGRLTASANAEAERVTAEADRLLAEAEETGREAAAEAAARVAKAQAIERRAREEAERLRAAAAEDAAAARRQARADVVRMLEAGREQRRRSDEKATARRAALLAQIAELESRWAAMSPTMSPSPTTSPTTRQAMAPEAVPPPREVPALEPRSVRGRSARDLLHLGRRHAG